MLSGEHARVEKHENDDEPVKSLRLDRSSRVSPESSVESFDQITG